MAVKPRSSCSCLLRPLTTPVPPLGIVAVIMVWMLIYLLVVVTMRSVGAIGEDREERSSRRVRVQIELTDRRYWRPTARGSGRQKQQSVVGGRPTRGQEFPFFVEGNVRKSRPFPAQCDDVSCRLTRKKLFRWSFS
jgi:hypothetical protein